MSGYVVNLTDYVPPARYDATPWVSATIYYSPDGVQAYVALVNLPLSPADTNPAQPRARSFTVSNAPTAAGWLSVTFFDNSGNQAPTSPVQYPPPTGHGASNPSLLSARYAVRHRIRDGIPLLDANPVPFSMVRLEDLSDQIPAQATPTQTTFQARFADVPTARYMNAQVCPATLVAFVDGSWTPTAPSADVDQNGNFTLPVAPVQRLMVTYAWQYLSDGEIDQFVDEGRQWLREFQQVAQVPDGLVPALISNASGRALLALQRSATLAPVKAGDLDVDWSKIGAAYGAQAKAEMAQADCERTAYYSQGAEALDPTVADVASAFYSTWTPLR